MKDLHRTVSVHIEVWGSLDDPATFLDLAHVLASSDIGQSHGGFTSEADLVEAVRDAYVGSQPLDLYSPQCSGRQAVENAVPALVAAGLSVRARFWSSVPAGYRYDSQDTLTHVVLATPDSRKPARFVRSGTDVLASLDAFETAARDGDPMVFVRDTRELALGREQAIGLSPRMIDWLGLEAAPTSGP